MAEWIFSAQFRRLFARALIAMLIATTAAAAVAQPSTCPLEGDARQALARQLNPYKNRQQAPTAHDINPAATLPAVLAPGRDLNRWSRNSAAIFESYVVGVKGGGIESVNCHAKDPAHRDTHIELALQPTASPRQRVIVEVTPRWRGKLAAVADWSTSALKRELLPQGVPQRVRITGWLFDDLEHRPQSENSNPGGASNWRATIWEIHPVTGIQLLSSSGMASAALVPRRPISHRRASRKCARSMHHLCRRRRTGAVHS